MTLEDLLDELHQFSPACDVCVRMSIPFDGDDERSVASVSGEIVDGLVRVYINAADVDAPNLGRVA